MIDSSSLVAVVTGGSSGIGKSICEHFLRSGYTVISLSRRPSPITDARLVDLRADLSTIDDVKQIADRIAKYSPTTLVLNAGASLQKRTEDVLVEDLNRQVGLSITSGLLLTQACLPAMRHAHFGRIVMISSRAIIGLAGVAAYSAAKSAQLGLARSWALEFGPSGITVNVIAPGPIKTAMFDVGSARAAEIERSLAGNLPMRRLGAPDDIARAVMFLAAPENSFITGQTIFVCGGSSLGGVNTLGAISAARNTEKQIG